MTTYADIYSGTDNATTFYTSVDVGQMRISRLKNLAECDDEYYHSMREVLREAIACYCLTMESYYCKLEEILNIQFDFPDDDKPAPMPTFQPGDSLYLFHIPLIAGISPDYLNTSLTRYEFLAQVKL
ncbi:MAG: hypothetical protein F6K40_29360 [Okeania sp. SIO3I5]|uniref:hypothetical protein n=1 Tax=Okeania sp. SIO3I5 TaxID=2607805 RepID=UPI0013B9D352|nr:hypothetical protein [Okeania sp. SIO3I5]NEQ40128.1 hypothetical protein [Okeania sp. SIO3I5]